jgi:hypothetical protein
VFFGHKQSVIKVLAAALVRVVWQPTHSVELESQNSFLSHGEPELQVAPTVAFNCPKRDSSRKNTRSKFIIIREVIKAN